MNNRNSFTKHRLSKPLKQELIRFFETHAPQSFSRNLRRMLLQHLQQQISIGFDIQMGNFLWSLNEFFELMDVAAKETSNWNCIDHKEERGG